MGPSEPWRQFSLSYAAWGLELGELEPGAADGDMEVVIAKDWGLEETLGMDMVVAMLK